GRRVEATRPVDLAADDPDVRPVDASGEKPLGVAGGAVGGERAVSGTRQHHDAPAPGGGQVRADEAGGRAVVDADRVERQVDAPVDDHAAALPLVGEQFV